MLHDTSNRTPIISQHTKINSSYRQQINSFPLFTISLLTSKDKIRDTEIKSNHALIPFLTLERLNQSNTHANTDCRLNHPLCCTIGTLFTCTFTRIGHTSSARNWRGGGTPNSDGDTITVQVVQGVGDEHLSWIKVVQWNKSDYYFSLLNQPNSTTTTTTTCCQGTSTPLTLQAQARKANKRQSLFVWHTHCYSLVPTDC